MKTNRNSPCPCGSGKKYKVCCLHKKAKMTLGQKLLSALILVIVLGGAFATIMSFSHRGQDPGPTRVWSEEHQHWH